MRPPRFKHLSRALAVCIATLFAALHSHHCAAPPAEDAAAETPGNLAEGSAGHSAAQPATSTDNLAHKRASPPSPRPKALLPRYQGEMIEGASALYSGDFARARDHYLEAMKLRPEKMAPALGALRTMLVDAQDQARTHTEAVVRERLADLEAIPEAEGAAYVLAARLAIALQRPGAALDAARLAVEHMPTHGVAWRVLGEAAILAEQWGRAQTSLRRAADLGLNAKAGTWERLANVLDELGELQGAERCSRRALELTGSDLHAQRRRLNQLAAILKHRGKLEETASVLKQATRLGPTDPAVLHNMATLAEAKGELDAALILYVQALEYGSNPMSSWRYGHLLLKLDRPQEALEAFTVATTQLARWTWPRSTRWWPSFEVGKMYAKNGHESEAVPWFENALREASIPRDVRSVRSWLSFSRVKSGTYTPQPEEP
jgi:tetratricopeptide (TPR) repeat protein